MTAAPPPARTFTADELRQCDGAEGRPVYLAVRGVVFNMSAGANFYGPGGPYHVFAGKECARALALMKLTQEYVGSDDLEGCSDKDIKILEDWVKKFKAKYPVVGMLQRP